nr:MAG TPA: hypothetical protein [Bacteriophage sp.]
MFFFSTQRIDEISDFFSPIFARVLTFSYIEEYTPILSFRFKISASRVCSKERRV